MSWPDATDYNEAVQYPALAFSDPDLRQGQPEVNAFGLPTAHAGNFAVVYKISSGGGHDWAIKCFTREVRGLRERYQALSEHLRQASLPFLVEFLYMDEGVRLGARWFPAVKMRWVEGLTLNEFVRQYLDRPTLLSRLGDLWVPLARRLHDAQMAHGDLQHGNVLLVEGSKEASLALKLIDYDGTYVPALASSPPGEVGHPNYQHPGRLQESAYGPKIDRFAHLVIYCALRCVALGGRALWDRYDNGDNLLFREEDFRAPASSPLLHELWDLADPVARALTGHLILASQDQVSRVPQLEKLLARGRTPSLPDAQEAHVRELLALRTGTLRHVPSSATAVAPVHCDTDGRVLRLLPLEPALPAAVPDTSPPPPPPRLAGVAETTGLPAAVPGTSPPPFLAAALAPQVTATAAAAVPPIPGSLTVAAALPASPATASAAPLRTPGWGELDILAATAVVICSAGAILLAVNPATMFPATGVLWLISAGLVVLRHLLTPTYPSRILQRHTASVYGVAFSPDGRRLASASADGTIKIWDVDKGRAVLTLRGHTATVYSVAFSPDGRFLASGSDDHTIRLWDAAKGIKALTFSGHQGPVRCIAFSADGRHLASAGGGDQTIRVWDVSRQEAFTLTGHRRFVNAVAFSPDGQFLASASQDLTVKVWDVHKRQEAFSLGDHPDEVRGVAFSPGGTFLASACADGSMRIWNLLQRETNFPLLGHTAFVTAVTFSPDGQHLASTSGDCTVRLWRALLGSKSFALRGHTGTVSSVAFSPDGRYLATASWDTTVRLWDVTRGT